MTDNINLDDISVYEWAAPYERQLDEMDQAYANRLEMLVDVSLASQDLETLDRIFWALMIDLGLPVDRPIGVPCTEKNDAIAIAAVQGVHPEAWMYATPAAKGLRFPFSKQWFAGKRLALGYSFEDLAGSILDADSPLGKTLFLGADGFPYLIDGSDPAIGNFRVGKTSPVPDLLKRLVGIE